MQKFFTILFPLLVLSCVGVPLTAQSLSVSVLGGGVQSVFPDQKPYQQFQWAPTSEVTLHSQRSVLPVAITVGYWDDLFPGPSHEWRDAVWYSYRSVYVHVQARPALVQLGLLPKLALGVSAGIGGQHLFRDYLYGHGFDGNPGTDHQWFSGQFVSGIWAQLAMTPHWAITGKVQGVVSSNAVPDGLRRYQVHGLVGITYQWE